MRYEFFEHTADVKFRAYGSGEEAFSNAIVAATAVLIEPEKLDGKLTKAVRVESETKRALLYDMLEELIFLMDTELFLTKEVRDLKISGEGPFTLTAVLIGDSIQDHVIGGDIKSATYNEMEITDDYVQVVLDI